MVRFLSILLFGCICSVSFSQETKVFSGVAKLKWPLPFGG